MRNPSKLLNDSSMSEGFRNNLNKLFGAEADGLDYCMSGQYLGESGQIDFSVFLTAPWLPVSACCPLRQPMTLPTPHSARSARSVLALLAYRSRIRADYRPAQIGRENNSEFCAPTQAMLVGVSLI
ncbi:hypothetical protein RRG08_056877 [Elysia crispata]|uniref:Uncharacterized protein n=1 Tax=Elysia crispata TaxID=231223 RepID=A0AAE0ZCC3_9GAST|nr:hypothetical protein RRG08_056877 [Elysia crispata]